MAFWEKSKQTDIESRLAEERIYEQVLREIESGIRRDGLWAKALQKGRGNERETKALYIEYRVQSLKDDAEISDTLSRAIDSYDEDGYTLLMRAVKKADVNAVVALIEQGANPRIKDENFGTSTALNMAKLLLKREKISEVRQTLQKIIDALDPIT